MTRREFKRIERLQQRFAALDVTHATVGIGDDCAQVDGTNIFSVDSFVEDIHFRPDFAPWRKLAARGLQSAVSDLIACGATPRSALLSLSLSNQINETMFDDIIAGFADVAEMHGFSVAGGNLCRSESVHFHMTVLGQAERFIARSGAQPGEYLYLTGPCGLAALGLRALLEPERHASSLTPLWLDRKARVDLLSSLQHFARSAIDISDGLAADAAHIAEASQVGLEIHAESIALATEFHPHLVDEKDIVHLPLFGGEDYEILFTSTSTPDTVPFAQYIGDVIDFEAGVRIVQHGKSQRLDEVAGFDHF